ncbi:hypothetical protein U1Q18_005377 [Sarracenia purpurea var. burkii]
MASGCQGSHGFGDAKITLVAVACCSTSYACVFLNRGIGRMNEFSKEIRILHGFGNHRSSGGENFGANQWIRVPLFRRREEEDFGAWLQLSSSEEDDSGELRSEARDARRPVATSGTAEKKISGY